MKNDIQKGLLIAFVGAFTLSFDTLLLRLVGGEPLQMAFWRGVFLFCAGCIAYVAVRLSGRRNVGFINGRAGLVASSFYGIASVCFVASAMMTSIANMLVIVATAPFWAAVGAAVILNERPGGRTWLASSVAFLGVLVVAWPGLSSGVHPGDGIALLAALGMAGAFVASRRTRANLVLAPAVGGLLSAVIVAPFAGRLWFDSAQDMALMAVEGVLLVPVALGLIAMAPRYLPAPQVGLFLLLETVLGPLWIWLVLSEQPTAYALLGGAIVVATLALHSLSDLVRSRRGINAGLTPVTRPMDKSV